jgi:glycosidase
MGHWSQDAIFYHLYPLGLCHAPHRNDFQTAPNPRLDRLLPWLDQARDMGASALYLGPVMESSAHGYDVADYFQVDRRLGDNATLAWLAEEARRRGLRLVLEGVFHHVGRDFWAFRDCLAQGRASRFADWFYLDFSQPSPLGDAFAYQSWNGCLDLVKLNLGNPEVRSHLLEAVATWLRLYHIDGLRLDAADKVDMGFLSELAAYCRSLKPDFWLMGEVLHGDYRRWSEQGGLDAVTNYECYKGLYSSLLESNFFEIAHSLRRQFDAYGLYRNMGMYNFVDNHDVDRLANRLNQPALLYPAYCLLLTMPGIPALYYGSEFGLTGVKAQDDWGLRPALDLNELRRTPPQPDLAPAIARLTHLRAACPALRQGDYRELALGHRHLVFARRCQNQSLVVGVSAETKPLRVDISVPEMGRGKLVDLLNPGRSWEVDQGRARGLELLPGWASVMEYQPSL